MPSIRTFSADVDAEVLAEELEGCGCAIVRERADRDTMDRLHAELQPHLETAPFGRTDFAGRTSRRRNSLLAKSPACQQLAIDPAVLGVCDIIFRRYCVRYRLHATSLIELHPGERRQVIHRDGGIYPIRHPAPPMTIGTIWAYTDFTAENGATLVAPGSHLWEHERVPEEHEFVNAAMPRGSVLIYTSSVLHGSDANRSNGVRTGLALHYNWGWLRQEENQVLSSPPEIARTFPERLQRLIGYDLGGPYLGFIEQGNPYQLMQAAPSGDYARTESELEARQESLGLLSIRSET